MRARERNAGRRKGRPIISERVHFRAVKYGFRGGDALRYWLDAETGGADAGHTGTGARRERGTPEKTSVLLR